MEHEKPHENEKFRPIPNFLLNIDGWKRYVVPDIPDIGEARLFVHGQPFCKCIPD
jgi:hypothetical protein